MDRIRQLYQNVSISYILDINGKYRNFLCCCIGAAYRSAFDFQEGYAAVLLGNVWQYIDQQGCPRLICPEADAIKPVRNGRARLLVNGEWREVEI